MSYLSSNGQLEDVGLSLKPPKWARKLTIKKALTGIGRAALAVAPFAIPGLGPVVGIARAIPGATTALRLVKAAQQVPGVTTSMRVIRAVQQAPGARTVSQLLKPGGLLMPTMPQSGATPMPAAPAPVATPAPSAASFAPVTGEPALTASSEGAAPAGATPSWLIPGLLLAGGLLLFSTPPRRSRRVSR